MQISHKLALCFAVIVLLSTLSTLLGLATQDTLNTEIHALGRDALPGVRHALLMKAEALDARNRESQLLVAKNADDVSETIGRLNKNMAELGRPKGEYRKTRQTPAIKSSARWIAHFSGSAAEHRPKPCQQRISAFLPHPWQGIDQRSCA